METTLGFRRIPEQRRAEMGAPSTQKKPLNGVGYI